MSKVKRVADAEFIKLKNTSFWGYMVVSTIGIIAMFILYNCLYASKAINERITLLFEIYAMMMPLLHSITISYFVRQEEKILNMYRILAVKSRTEVFAGKILMIWGMETIRLLLIFLIVIVQLNTSMSSKLIVMYVLGEVICSVFSIVFHLFVNLKIGVSLSLFFGVAEVMQSIMYSNIDIKGGWKYLPMAWSMEWKFAVMNHTYLQEGMFWGSCVLIICMVMALAVFWFRNWEGRRK